MRSSTTSCVRPRRRTLASPDSRALDTDTIAAVATAAGQGGIGIVRLSGPRAQEIATDMTGKQLVARRVQYGTFLDDRGEPVDHGIVLYFAAPHSFTGEDVVELQGHGGPVVLQLVLDAALARGARLARPGEFTERAFLNGKLDLAQAEAVADLIASASAAAARGALRSLQGAFSSAVEGIDQAVLALRVFVEAAMDFPEEAVEFLAEGQVAQQLAAICGQIDGLLRDTRQGVLLRDGIVIALIGEPNVGKSSLLNRLVGQERAIVSDVPGTTRDFLEVDLVLDGLPVRIVDTAGLRDSTDTVEQEGIRRARQQAERADLVLVLEDDRTAGEWGVSSLRGLLGEMLPQIESDRVLRVLNKVDLSGHEPGPVFRGERSPAELRISATTGAGLNALIEGIKRLVGYAGEGTAFTARQRHVQALRDARGAVAESSALLASGETPELVAEELRSAHRFLGGIVGAVSADELLGEIFSRFCIGK